MTRPSFEFLRYLAGRRGPASALTSPERALLRELAHGRRSVVEVGVYEGATSAVLANAIAPDGRLWLVDPFSRDTRPERWLGISYSSYIAHHSVSPWPDRVRFVQETSIAAAAKVQLNGPAELIFIDADHAYSAVKADFIAWHPHLAEGGSIAFHDSRMCPARPDLAEFDGPVRLMEEILRGDHGDWILAHAADSISVIRSAVKASR